MRDPVIACDFDGLTREGRDIVIHVAIGEPYDLRSDNGDPNPGFCVEVELLM